MTSQLKFTDPLIYNFKPTITAGATGHRPDKMGGYQDNLGGYNRNHPIAVELKKNTIEVIEDLIVNKGISRFVSGGALGFDTLFFWCVNHFKSKYPHIENVVAVPFINQWTAWVRTSPNTVQWYHKMLEMADHVIDVARHPNYTTYEDQKTKPIRLDDFSTKKMFNRNKYMVDQLSYLVAFFDGSRSGTGQCIRYALQESKTNPTIINLNPQLA